MRAADFVAERTRSGRVAFTVEELRAYLRCSREVVIESLGRLADEGSVREVSRHYGVWVVVPEAYYEVGTPPLPWFIDDLMRYMKRSYYVGLATAVELHLGKHRSPRSIQVVTDGPTASIPITGDTIEIHVTKKKELEGKTTAEELEGVGVMKLALQDGASVFVSTPEQTALDFIHYLWRDPYVATTANIIATLAPKIDPERLRITGERVARASLASCQRLGYVLDVAGFKEKTEPLATVVERIALKRGEQCGPLVGASAKMKGEQENWRWYLYINREIKPRSLDDDTDDLRLPILKNTRGYSRRGGGRTGEASQLAGEPTVNPRPPIPTPPSPQQSEQSKQVRRVVPIVVKRKPEA